MRLVFTAAMLAAFAGLMVLSACSLDLFFGGDENGAGSGGSVGASPDAQVTDPGSAPFVTTPQLDDDTDTCGRSTLMTFVGQLVDVIPPILIPAGSRVYETGAMLTMDFRLDRINIEYDPISRDVVQITCG